MQPTEEFRTYLGGLQTDVEGKYQANESGIVDALLDYTHFNGTSGTRPEPFDDPFVGAALFTDDYRLLGAYRKRQAGERHSEPEAFLQALRGTNCASAEDFVRKIEQAYARRLWLESGGQTQFEDLFRAAAQVIRKAYQTSALIMFSSLEPCGSYEAQPSCSHILCACGVNHVWYASDDINPKGMRPAVSAGGALARASIQVGLVDQHCKN